MRACRFVALVLAALSLTMESAHVLELPQKLQYDPEQYAAVNGTLYRYFAIVGGIYQLGAIVAVGVLAVLVRRRRRTVGWTLAAAALLVAAFGIWLGVVAPVNARVAAHLGEPETIQRLWAALRLRWELGHAAGFLVQLLGFAALVVSVLVETPSSARQPYQTPRKSR